MSKPIIRFLGALLMLASIIAGILSSLYYQVKIDNSISSREYAIEQFKDSVEGITFEDIKKAQANADKVYENAGESLLLIYGLCCMVFIGGMFVAIVTPFSKKPESDMPSKA